MEPLILEAASAAAGDRLDAYLAAAVPELTRSLAQKLIADGRVLVNGAAAAKSCRLSGGERISVTLPEPEPIEALPEDIPLDVVYEDADLIVVNKPKGMVVHPAPGHASGTLVNALLFRCAGSLSGVGGAERPGIVHRIDRDTSGLLVVAKNDFAHQGLSAQLSDHSLARTYECLARGRFREDAGTVDAPIGRSPQDRKKMAVVPGGRPAVTHWEVIARYEGVTHLRCRLETGRTHQIRVHLSHIGHPILGDPVYGTKREDPDLHGQCLHAAALRFIHPRTGAEMTFTAPLPEEFRAELERLRRISQ